MTPPYYSITHGDGPMCYQDTSSINSCEGPNETWVCSADKENLDLYTPLTTENLLPRRSLRQLGNLGVSLQGTASAFKLHKEVAGFSLTSFLRSLSAGFANFGCGGNPIHPRGIPTADIQEAGKITGSESTSPSCETNPIPVTQELAKGLIEFFCDGGCGSLYQTLHLEEYVRDDLVFQRDKCHDGKIFVKEEDGNPIFELREEGIISNLEHQKEFNFCPTMWMCSVLIAPDGTEVAGSNSCHKQPRSRPCDNPVKIGIAALFGERELQKTSLTKAESNRAKELREVMGLDP